MAWDESEAARYNVQIVMNNGEDYKFKNFTYKEVRAFQKIIWVNGFILETNPGICWEFIDPLRIKEVFALKQTPEIIP